MSYQLVLRNKAGDRDETDDDDNSISEDNQDGDEEFRRKAESKPNISKKKFGLT